MAPPKTIDLFHRHVFDIRLNPPSTEREGSNPDQENGAWVISLVSSQGTQKSSIDTQKSTLSHAALNI
eukprot:9867532-Ditylum_brightwellii.AAC.1